MKSSTYERSNEAAVPDGEGWKRYVYVRDVQGNIRAVVGENNAVAEQTDYYPYGMPMADVNSASAQPFKFGGKELEREGGMDYYDFEARRLDFALGRFTSPDPLCEQTPEVSPYAYCAADPVNFIDPTGMIVIDQDSIFYNHKEYLKNQITFVNNNIQQNTNENITIYLEQFLNALNRQLHELNTLEDSDQVYEVKQSARLKPGTGENTYDPDTGVIYIELNGTQIDLLAEEFTHAYQFEVGKLSYSQETGNASFLYDINDEVEAKNAGRILIYGYDFFKSNKRLYKRDVKKAYKTVLKNAQKIKTNNIYRIKNGEKYQTIYD